MLSVSQTGLIGCTESSLSSAAPAMEGPLWADGAFLPLWGEKCSFFIRACGVFRLSCNSDDTSSTQTGWLSPQCPLFNPTVRNHPASYLLRCVSTIWQELLRVPAPLDGRPVTKKKAKQKRTLTPKTSALVSLSHVSVQWSDERLGSSCFSIPCVSILPNYYSACSHNL